MSRLAWKTCKENIIQNKIVFNKYKYLCFEFCPGAQGLYQANLLLSGYSPVTVQIQLPKTRSGPGAGPDRPRPAWARLIPSSKFLLFGPTQASHSLAFFGISIVWFQKRSILEQNAIIRPGH